MRKAFFRSLLRPNREYSCSYEVSAIQFDDIESGAGEILISGGAGTAVVPAVWIPAGTELPHRRLV